VAAVVLVEEEEEQEEEGPAAVALIPGPTITALFLVLILVEAIDDNWRFRSIPPFEIPQGVEHCLSTLPYFEI
jgi:hypothetical protein